MMTESQQRPIPFRPIDGHEEAEGEGEALRTAQATVRDLRVRNHRLTESLRELESFCHLMAHDLRAPLHAISCFGQALQQGEAERLSDAGRHKLDRMVQGAMRMDAMIGEVLAYAQAERAELRLREVDLGLLAHDVVDSLAGAYPRTTVRVGALPTVVCDGVLVRQVLANLVANAMKFSESRDAPEVKIDSFADARFVEVRVHDNGVGFDAAYAHRLFGLFQRLHTQREFPGSGMGLAIVKRVIDRHRGSVRAESGPGPRTTFAFTLPTRGDAPESGRP